MWHFDMRMDLQFHGIYSFTICSINAAKINVPSVRNMGLFSSMKGRYSTVHEHTIAYRTINHHNKASVISINGFVY